MSLVDSDVLLGIGARLEDRYGDGAGPGFGFLAGVDRLGLESHRDLVVVFAVAESARVYGGRNPRPRRHRGLGGSGAV